MPKYFKLKDIANSFPVVVAIMASFVSLGACSWQPFGAPDRGDLDLISSLVYDPHRQTQRLMDGHLPTNKAISSTSQSYSLPSASPTLSLAGAYRCLSARGMPSETLQPADPTHFAKRERFDAKGQPIASLPMLIVLHETVASEQDTLNLFRTPQNNQAYQASYHMLLPEDGRRVRIVSDQYRAFGAGDLTDRHISPEILMRLPTAWAGEAVAAAQLA